MINSRINTIVSSILKDARIGKGLAKKELASRCGLTYSQLKAIEDDDNQINLYKLFNICDVLEISPSKVLDEAMDLYLLGEKDE